MIDGKDNENKKWALKSELLEQRNRPSDMRLGRSVARKINLRNTPEILFELDDSLEYGAKIDSILKEIMPKKEEEK